MTHEIDRRQFQLKSYMEASEVHTYEDSRPFYSIPALRQQGYDSLLPQVNGYEAVDVIHAVASESTVQPTMLDVGCGSTAMAISQLTDALPIRGIGINALVFKNLIAQHDRLDVQQGDIQRLTDYIAPESIDVAMSVFAITYCADPFAVVEGVNQVLRPHGVAFLRDIPITSVIPELQDPAAYEYFKQYCEGTGWFISEYQNRHILGNPTLWNIAYVKNQNSLALPLVPTGTISQRIQLPRGQEFAFTSLTYSLGM